MTPDIYIDPMLFVQYAKYNGFFVKPLPKEYSEGGKIVLLFEVFQMENENNFAIFDFCQKGLNHARRWIDNQS